MAKNKCNLIVIDDFYTNPNEVRDFVLNQPFGVTGNYPGKRTKSYANDELRETIQKYVQPFGGKITEFKSNETDYNGSFQYTTSRDRSWIHVDPFNNWGGVIYLTPDAPLSSGTGFYRYKETGKEYQSVEHSETDKYSQDITKWDLIDSVGNVFNRLILFNSKRFHISMDYFGTSVNDSRLFQVLFFSTEN